MTTTEPTTEAPPWINLDAVFDPECHLPERIVELVEKGEQILEALHAYIV